MRKLACWQLLMSPTCSERKIQWQKCVDNAHQPGAKVLVDGAQAVMHHAVDVQALDCDFYVFSGHKLYGPTGIGVLYVKEDILQAMPPWEGGGSMIATVSLREGTTWTKATVAV